MCVFFVGLLICVCFFCKQKMEYDLRIIDWSSDVCSSDLGFIRLQPSEFMKIAVVLSLAKFFHRLPAIYVSTPSVLVAPIALFAVPAALVILQPDLGTAQIGRASCRERRCKYV